MRRRETAKEPEFGDASEGGRRREKAGEGGRRREKEMRFNDPQATRLQLLTADALATGGVSGLGCGCGRRRWRVGKGWEHLTR